MMVVHVLAEGKRQEIWPRESGRRFGREKVAGDLAEGK